MHCFLHDASLKQRSISVPAGCISCSPGALGRAAGSAPRLTVELVETASLDRVSQIVLTAGPFRSALCWCVFLGPNNPTSSLPRAGRERCEHTPAHRDHAEDWLSWLLSLLSFSVH